MKYNAFIYFDADGYAYKDTTKEDIVDRNKGSIEVSKYDENDQLVEKFTLSQPYRKDITTRKGIGLIGVTSKGLLYTILMEEPLKEIHRWSELAKLSTCTIGLHNEKRHLVSTACLEHWGYKSTDTLRYFDIGDKVGPDDCLYLSLPTSKEFRIIRIKFKTETQSTSRKTIKREK